MALAFFERALTVVLGGGDLASGVVYRLYRAGFPVIVTELSAPVFVRRAVCYGEAVYTGTVTVDGVTARLTEHPDEARAVLQSGAVPVLVDPAAQVVPTLHPVILVDARMEKTNLGIRQTDAPLVIALGPGFTAGVDCHAVIETRRGHTLGRVIVNGSAEPDTGEPDSVKGETYRRVLRAPKAGHVRAHAGIGDFVRSGEMIATLDGEPIRASFDGVLRGIIHEQVTVSAGMKIGDLDPRGRRENCFTISDKSLAVGGGVVEAVLSAPQIRPYLLHTADTDAAL